MDAPIQPPVRDKGMPQAVAGLKRELERRGIDLAYCADSASAVDYLLSRIPAGATVMNGGSTTLEQIGFLDALKDGPYDWLRPRVKAVSDPEERVRARRRATIADYFVGGINAITAAGEIVNADGSGKPHRRVRVRRGKAPPRRRRQQDRFPTSLARFERLRNVAAVQECRHLGASTPCALTGRCDNAACRGPDRQCGKVLVIENERIPGRICVVMIGAALGY